jgi:branched-subunit amino acid ABC-type transport system permease component
VSAQFFLQQCLIGLTNGALVALVALGYTMVYGIIGLINFAHGDLIMLGACLALSLVSAWGLATAGPTDLAGYRAADPGLRPVLRRLNAVSIESSTSRCGMHRSSRRLSRRSACRSSS